MERVRLAELMLSRPGHNSSSGIVLHRNREPAGLGRKSSRVKGGGAAGAVVDFVAPDVFGGIGILAEEEEIARNHHRQQAATDGLLEPRPSAGFVSTSVT